MDFERTVSIVALSPEQDVLSRAGVFHTRKATVEKSSCARIARISQPRRFFIYCIDLHLAVSSQFILFFCHSLDKYSLDHFSCSEVDLKFRIRSAFASLLLANRCSEAAVDELASSAVGRVNRILADHCVGQD